MNHIIDSEPSCYEEASSQQVWRDAMMDVDIMVAAGGIYLHV
jgi:hypothetical protein